MTYKIHMTPERAREVLADVRDLRRKFGIQVSVRDFSADDVLDALVLLDDVTEREHGDELVKAKQALGAAKSREKRSLNAKYELEKEVKSLQEQLKKAQEEIESLKAG